MPPQASAFELFVSKVDNAAVEFGDSHNVAFAGA
jgi:hypothetical protein